MSESNEVAGDDAGEAAGEGGDAWARGVAKMTEVYAGEVITPPQGSMPFSDVMLETLFAEVWDRDVLSVRDRRLLIMGVIAARGGVDTWKIQSRAALRNGELTADELRETLVMLAPYAGYPSVAPLVVETEGVIHRFEKEAAEQADPAG
jgi:4-carboxymuconolactone decarboxylase